MYMCSSAARFTYKCMSGLWPSATLLLFNAMPAAVTTWSEQLPTADYEVVAQGQKVAAPARKLLATSMAEVTGLHPDRHAEIDLYSLGSCQYECDRLQRLKTPTLCSHTSGVWFQTPRDWSSNPSKPSEHPSSCDRPITMPAPMQPCKLSDRACAM